MGTRIPPELAVELETTGAEIRNLSSAGLPPKPLRSERPQGCRRRQALVQFVVNVGLTEFPPRTFSFFHDLLVGVVKDDCVIPAATFDDHSQTPGSVFHRSLATSSLLKSFGSVGLSVCRRRRASTICNIPRASVFSPHTDPSFRRHRLLPRNVTFSKHPHGRAVSPQKPGKRTRIDVCGHILRHFTVLTQTGHQHGS